MSQSYVKEPPTLTDSARAVLRAIATDGPATRPQLSAALQFSKPTMSAAVSELEKYGYRIVIFPGGTARFVSARLQAYFASLKTHGTTKPMWDQMNDFDQLNELIGTPELIALGQQYEQG